MEFFLWTLFTLMLTPALTPILKTFHPCNKWKELWTRTGAYTHDYDTKKLQLPRLVSKRKTPTGQALTFRLPTGFSPDDLEKSLPAIAYEFNCEPVIDTNGKDVTIYLNTQTLPKTLSYDPQPVTGTLPFYIGQSMTGPIIKDLALLPHLLIAGQTGGGKTTLLKLILSYLIRSQNVTIYAADMARTDLTWIENYGGIFVPDSPGLKIVIDELHHELFNRLDKLKAMDSENLFEYNKKVCVNLQLKRVVLAVDELAVFRPRPGMDKEEKDSLLSSFGRLIDLAQVGRKAGVHLILSTQQPNKDVIPALLRDNIPCRIAFKCVTRYASDSILQSSSALYLPQIPGRCILQHDEEIQIQVPDYNKGVMTSELASYRL